MIKYAAKKGEEMAYRYGNREQFELLPQSIEDYVSKEDAVRVYDAFVESVDFGQLGIDIDEHQVANSEYDPKAMLKLLVYGYSYGVKGSRKLERECHHNLSFIWLMGGLKPDHRTIAECRRGHKKALKQVLKQCVRIDQQEEGLGSSVAVNRELIQAEGLKKKIKDALEGFKDSGRGKINLTDPDCAVMHSVQGSHASYNVQSVVDEKHGLIVHAEAVSQTSDVNQLAEQIQQANETMNKRCEVACADAGYADTAELKKIDEQGIKVVVPSQRQALHKKEESPFSKSHFRYDKEKDCYFCPEQNELPYEFTDPKRGKKYYRIRAPGLCHRCVHYGKFTSNKNGRRIMRLVLEDFKEKFEAQYEASQEIYARRKTRAEHPFGHIKRNLKTDGFMLRGKDGVQAETSLLATCFDLRRMMTIVGISALIEKLTAPAIPVMG